MKAPHRCLGGCGTYITRGSRCTTCRATQKAPYADPEYKRLRELVLARDAWTCQLCGAPADTADHIIPLARGGKSTLKNMQAACHPCNSGKRDR